MQTVLLRVGIDTGTGGIHGPLFRDGSFEFVPIPDRFGGSGVDARTYGNTVGRQGHTLVNYFPTAHRARAANQSIHFDPEFATFTYGDPTAPKSALSRLTEGSLLVFYAGLRGFDFECPPALYIIGYFEVARSGRASSYTEAELAEIFHGNFHVMHPIVFADQRDRLVLVRGTANSRLLTKAVRLSSLGVDRNDRPLHRLAPEMQQVFGDFGGHTGIQRSPPRWVAPQFVQRAAAFVKSLV